MTNGTTDHFGSRLLRALDAANMTQAELSRQCNVSRTAVSKWVRGTYPTVDLALQISDSLNVSVRWLVAGGATSHRGIQLTDLEKQLISYLRMLETSQAVGVLAHAKGIAPAGNLPTDVAPRLSEAVARKLSLVWPPPKRRKATTRK